MRFRNVGDEELRALERAVAEGQHGAAARLAVAYERRGRCRCGSTEIVAHTPARQPRCRADAALSELEALEKSTSTYTGYVSSELILDAFEAGLREGLSGGARPARFYVTTVDHFPLAVVLRYETARPRGRRGGSGMLAWSAVDPWLRGWYGRNAGRGRVTGMRLYKQDKLTGEASMARERRRYTASEYLPDHNVYVRLLREAQALWHRGAWPPSVQHCPDCGGVEGHEVTCPRREPENEDDFEVIVDHAILNFGPGEYSVFEDHGELFLEELDSRIMWAVNAAGHGGFTFDRIVQGERDAQGRWHP